MELQQLNPGARDTVPSGNKAGWSGQAASGELTWLPTLNFFLLSRGDARVHVLVNSVVRRRTASREEGVCGEREEEEESGGV